MMTNMMNPHIMTRDSPLSRIRSRSNSRSSSHTHSLSSSSSSRGDVFDGARRATKRARRVRARPSASASSADGSDDDVHGNISRGLSSSRASERVNDGKDDEEDDDYGLGDKDEGEKRFEFDARARARATETATASDDEPREDPAEVAARNERNRAPSERERERERERVEARERAEREANALVTRAIECPRSMVGRIIGKGGETIKSLQAQSGAHVSIDQSSNDDEPRKIIIAGALRSVDTACALVENLLLGTGPGSGMLVAPGQISKLYECPKEAVGKLIGRGGETIRGIQMATGARLQIDQTRSPCQVVMAGSEACVEACVRVVKEIIEGGSTALFNEYARGGQGFGGQGYGAATTPTMWSGYGGVASGGAYAPPAAYSHAAYAQMYAAHTQHYAAVAAPQVVATPIWRAVDDGKGNTYYYNTLTGVSQWEKP